MLEFDSFYLPDGLEHGARASCAGRGHGGARCVDGRDLADPRFPLGHVAVGDRAPVGKIAANVQPQAKSGNRDASTDAFVRDPVCRAYGEVIIQLGGRTVDRDPEGFPQIASVGLVFPERPQLDELESSLDAPPQGNACPPQLTASVW